MKRNRLIYIISCFFLFGCNSGGGGSSPTSPSTAPTISSLRVSPSSATLNQGGGAVTLDIYVDFFDADGDISNYTVTISKVDANEQPIGSPVIATVSFNGVLTGKTSGTAHWTDVGDTTYAHTSTFSIYFSDAVGNKSNTLTISWKVG